MSKVTNYYENCENFDGHPASHAGLSAASLSLSLSLFLSLCVCEGFLFLLWGPTWFFLWLLKRMPLNVILSCTHWWLIDYFFFSIYFICYHFIFLSLQHQSYPAAFICPSDRLHLLVSLTGFLSFYTTQDTLYLPTSASFHTNIHCYLPYLHTF